MCKGLRFHVLPNICKLLKQWTVVALTFYFILRQCFINHVRRRERVKVIFGQQGLINKETGMHVDNGMRTIGKFFFFCFENFSGTFSLNSPNSPFHIFFDCRGLDHQLIVAAIRIRKFQALRLGDFIIHSLRVKVWLQL